MDYLLRLGAELTLKSAPVRRQFTRILLGNLKRAFAFHHIKVSFSSRWSRIIISLRSQQDQNRVETILSRIFGISSFSRILASCKSTLPDIVSLGTELYGDKVAGISFAIDVQRSGKHSFSSLEVKRGLGAALRPKAAKVDLANPQVLIEIDIKDDKAYFFSERIKAAGGFPLGTSGKLLALVSGGFDSIAASWMCMRRGATLEFLLFEMVPGGVQFREVAEILQNLLSNWAPGYSARLLVVNFSPVVSAINKNVSDSYAQVMLKRLFYRSAQEVATIRNAEAIVTGEALAQVSSQTLSNLAAIEDGIDACILRPLIAFEKQDIMNLCKEIGVYEICARTQEFCQISSQKPVTRASKHILNQEESALSTEALKEQIQTYQLSIVKGMPPLAEPKPIPKSTLKSISHLPCKAVFIKIVSPEKEFEKVPPPGVPAQRVLYYCLEDFEDIIATLDCNASYIFYCDHGFQSKVAATLLLDQGFREVYIWQPT